MNMCTRNSGSPNEPVISRLIPTDARLSALPRHFGRLHILVESAVFDWMRRLSPEYHGAYWDFFELSNSGFYMAPHVPSPLHVQWPINHFDAALSADAAGIVVCLFTFSDLSFRYEAIADHFHALRDFACTHAEARTIFEAID